MEKIVSNFVSRFVGQATHAAGLFGSPPPFPMPRTFSADQGRRPDPKLFPVHTDESGESTNAIPDWLCIDACTLG
jgi:hypothetical protein